MSKLVFMLATQGVLIVLAAETIAGIAAVVRMLNQ
jgi:hypothetical protein